MASQMRAMSDGPGWGFLNDLLAQMVERVDQLMEFGLHEQAEYAAMVAERRTLRTPQAVVDAVIEAGRRAEQNLNEMVSQMEAREDHHGG